MNLKPSGTSCLPARENLQSNDAFRTLKAKKKIGEGITCETETLSGAAGITPYLKESVSEKLERSGKMLLEALVVCSGVTLSAAADTLGVELKDATITAEGQIKYIETYSIRNDTNPNFHNIHLQFALETGATQAELECLIHLVDSYREVYMKLVNSSEFKISYQLK